MRDKTDLQIQATAVGMWANYVETGDMNLSAKDAENCKKPFRALDQFQMGMVLRFRELVTSLLKQDSDIRMGSRSGKAVAVAVPQPQQQQRGDYRLSWEEDHQGDLELKVGRIFFASVQGHKSDPSRTDTSVQAVFHLKGIKSDQGRFSSTDKAVEHLERAAKAWLAALEG